MITAVGNKAVNDDALRLVGPEGTIMLFASRTQQRLWAGSQHGPPYRHQRDRCGEQEPVGHVPGRGAFVQEAYRRKALIETTFPLKRWKTLALASFNNTYRVVVTM